MGHAQYVWSLQTRRINMHKGFGRIALKRQKKIDMCVVYMYMFVFGLERWLHFTRGIRK